jgi:hypothetical protein
VKYVPDVMRAPPAATCTRELEVPWAFTLPGLRKRASAKHARRRRDEDDIVAG